MPDPYLIAHKVRGQPAFDVAIRMDCPECAAQGCGQCDDLGYWWIIPTSGHRAFPAQTWDLRFLYDDPDHQISVLSAPMPNMSALPDHYPSTPTSTPKLDLISALGIKPKVPPKIERRI
jgi:hypothetical protein